MGRNSARIAAKKSQPPRPDYDLNEDEIEADDDEFRVLRALESEFGTGARHEWNVKVYKVIERPNRRPIEGWVFDFDVRDLGALRQKLASEEGPGRYRVRVTMDRDSFKQYDLDIEADLRPAKTTPSAPPAQAAGDGLSPFERAMLAMMDAQDRRHSELLARISQPQANQLSNMEQIATLLKSVREIAGPENTGLQMFREGIAFAKEMIPKGGGGGGGAGVAELAMTALEKLPEVLDRLGLTGQTVSPQAALPPPRATQPLPTAKTPATAPPGPAQHMPAQFAQLKDFLLAKANEKADPALFADYTLRQLGDAGTMILDQADDPVSYLATQFPEIGAHRDWFERLFDAMSPPDDAPAEQSLSG